MSEQEDDDQQRFDAVLRQLLTTPPRPRDQLKRGKGKPSQADGDSASAERREPSP